MTDAEEFFYEHAGWSYNPETQTEEQGRRASATELVEAEEWARDHDVTFSWEPDWSVGDHQKAFDCYEDGSPETCETAFAWHHGRIAASLGCIDDADDNYRRVIEAELAAIVLADVMSQ